MAWMQCRDCGAKFAIGLLRCPQCNAMSELYAVPEEVIEAEQEAEANVPKISVGAGASNALGEPIEEEVSATEPAEAPENLEPETSGVTSDASDEEGEPDEGADAAEASPAASGAAVTAEPVAASKPAKKSAAKKTAAKAEPAPKE